MTQKDFGVPYDLIREDGRLEKVCKHGVGHTVGHVRGFLRPYDGVHGCDGCCSTYQCHRTQKLEGGISL